MGQTVIQRLQDAGLVGVMPPHETVALKRHSLLFRQIVVPAWEVSLREVEGLLGPQLARELEWLRELGIVVGLSPDDVRPSLAGQPVPEEVEAHRATVGQLIKDIQHLAGRPLDGADNAAFDEHAALLGHVQTLIRLAERRNSSLARYIGALLRLVSVSAVPAITEWNQDARRANLESVVHVLIDNIPIPDEDTPWEQLLEFRQDDRVRLHYEALRLWTVRAASGETSPHDLAGEIEASVGRFESYMRSYHIGRTLGSFESVIRAAAVGAIAGIGMDERAAIAGAVGSIAVTLMRRQAELQREEMAAPGSELAFISKARERFGR